MIKKKQYQKTFTGFSTDDIDQKVNQMRDKVNVTAVQNNVIVINGVPLFLSTVIYDADFHEN